MSRSAKRSRSDDQGGESQLFRGGTGSSSADVSSRRTAKASRRLRSSTESEYLDEMAKLNYQATVFASQKLSEGIPEDSHFVTFAKNYINRAESLRRKYNREQGDCVVFGMGDAGELGLGQAQNDIGFNRLIVPNLRGKNIVAISCGAQHTLAIDSVGKVWSWGCGDSGCLGNVPIDEGYLPGLVTGFFPSKFGYRGSTNDVTDSNGNELPMTKRKEQRIVKVAAGETTSLALSDEGDVFIAGTLRDDGKDMRDFYPADETRSETGNKDMALLEADDHPDFYKPPKGTQDFFVHVTKLKQRVTDIAAGESLLVAQCEDGSLVTWGLAQSGELGRDMPSFSDPNSDVRKNLSHYIPNVFLNPQPPRWAVPSSDRKVIGFAAGGFHLLVVVIENGVRNVYATGLNNYGQLGLGDVTDAKQNKNRSKLTKITALEGKDIDRVAAGFQHSLFLSNSGRELYSCGRGDYGQLGCTLQQPETGFSVATPKRVPLVYDNTVESVENPREYSIDVTKIDETIQPDIVQLTGGSSTSAVLCRGGDVYTWGYNDEAQCGQKQDPALRDRKDSACKDIFRPKMMPKTVKGGFQFIPQQISLGGQFGVMLGKTTSNKTK